MGPCRPSNDVPTGVRLCGKAERLLRFPTRLDGGQRARRPGSQSMGGKLRNVHYDFQRRSPMFRSQMLQAGTSRPLPHRAPFDGAAPQLAQLQMARYHVGVHGRVYSGITDATKTRSTIAKRLVHSFRGVSAETLHIRRPAS